MELYAYKYRRVSSKRQEKGFSLPAQDELLEEYAKKKGITIVGDFCEPESGKKAGRTQFNLMLRELRNNPQVRIILTEKTDRVYRNFKDYVTLDEFEGLEVHLVKEGQVINDRSSSHEKFIHAMKVLMAKNYIDNLSEEIRKGRNEMIKQGYYPHKAPIGYKNIRVGEDKKARIEIDEEKAPFVKRLFELYASGFSAEQVRKKLISEGLYNKNTCYAKSHLIKILHDPFYIGKFEIKGIVYEGKHTPIIDIDLWNSVQKMFNQSKARTHDIQFDYAGLIYCGHCGCQLTAELKKGKYIYYHCTGKRGGTCKKDYIRQEQIEKVIVRLLERIQIPAEFHEAAIAALKEMQNVKQEYEELSVDNINKQIKTLSKRIDKLYTDKLDGLISEEFWAEKYQIWNNEKFTLLNKLQSLEKTSDRFYEGSNLLLNFCKDAPSLYLSKSPEQKRKILKMIGSNFYYKDGKLTVELNSVFEYLLNFDFSKNGGTYKTKLELFFGGLKENMTADIFMGLKLAA